MDSRHYLTAYTQGNHAEVWNTIVQLGPDAYVHPYREAVYLVVAEAIQRVRSNLSHLVQRLQFLRYQFAYPAHVWIEPDRALLHDIDDVTQTYGALPLAVACWFRTIGQVNFMGNHPTLSRYTPSCAQAWDSATVSNLTIHSEPLVLTFDTAPRNDVAIDFYITPKERRILPVVHAAVIDAAHATIDIAPDIYHKSGESGGGNLFLPLAENNSVDGIMIDPAHTWTGTTFMDYLRVTFRYGGFPGFRFYEHDPAFPKQEIAFLTKDLLLF